MKRKTPFQLQALEKFYAEQQYPTHQEMEDISRVLDLTHRQVRVWFVEKRRRDKGRDKLIITPPGAAGRGKNCALNGKIVRRGGALDTCRDKCNSSLSSEHRGVANGSMRKNSVSIKDFLSPDYILCKIFRKDGPQLGVEFDSLPSRRHQSCEDSDTSDFACQGDQERNKRKKVSKDANRNGPTNKYGMGKGLMMGCAPTKKYGMGKGLMMGCAPTKKHGIGKGLMTVWRATNPTGGDFPTGISNAHSSRSNEPQELDASMQTPERQSKKRKQSVSITRKLAKRTQELKKPSTRTQEVQSQRKETQKLPTREKCGLALERVISMHCVDQFLLLIDDEELELRELQAGQNPPTCSDHYASSQLYSCTLCKELLPKFPPNSIKMKLPFSAQPWESSPETVKKLFKAFHFIYTYSVPVGICDFTLDEFAQAFHDKESMLLGKAHLALLKLLLNDIEMEINNPLLPPLSVSCKFLALLHSVENEGSILEFWKNSLNPLTWTEILRQVMVAAGYGSKPGANRKNALNKDMRVMQKLGLRPKTLKGELFRILSEQGNMGSKVSDLAKSSRVTELDLTGSTEELESLICSSLSSDISLFEKISLSVYRVRLSAFRKEEDDSSSDSEDSGSIHDSINNTTSCSSDSECDSDISDSIKSKHIQHCKNKKNKLVIADEIDESHPGEVWLLGLIEGEYSDLSIDEKLTALVALIDLLSAGSSIRIEDPTKALIESAFNPPHCGSGAKMKRSMPMPRPSWVHHGQFGGSKEISLSSKFCPIDSSALNLESNEKNLGKDNGAIREEHGISGHPMQSIFLGSDRRYNRYWLFLGPCNAYDPGHKRIYFESSEDGHWEVIDTEEALHSLLSVLDDRGKREAHLVESLEKREAFLCQEMSTGMVHEAESTRSVLSEQSELDHVREDNSSPLSDIDRNLHMTEIRNHPLPQRGAIILESGKKNEEECRRWNRLQDFDAWIWNYFYCHLNAVKHCRKSYFDLLARCQTCHDLYWREEKHCRICHETFELDFDQEERYAIHSATCRDKGEEKTFPKHKVLSSSLQALKAAVHAIELVMPEGSLVGAWTKSAHRLWVKRLRRTSCLHELLQVVTDFVAAINEDSLYQCTSGGDPHGFMDELVSCFPSMPQTSSALALWLTKLDERLSPRPQVLLCL